MENLSGDRTPTASGPAVPQETLNRFRAMDDVERFRGAIAIAAAAGNLLPGANIEEGDNHEPYAPEEGYNNEL